MSDDNRKRIIDQPTDTALSPGDLIIVDSEESGVGTRKFDLGTELGTIKADLQELQDEAGVTADLKAALLQLASKVAYIDDDGQSYYDDLYDALYPNASSISCVYTQTGTVYTTDTLDSLKDDLVVTAHYSDSTTKTLKPSDYTLSGTLTAGTSTISVHYGDLVTTFTVTVTARTLSSISAAYTQNGTVYTDDDLDSLKSDLIVTATYSDSSTEVLSDADYTLSGSLTSGTSTITVTYEDKTTTFTVTVTAPLYSIADFAESSITVSGKTATIKKENNIYTYNGRISDNVYIYPNGTLNSSRSTTLWFSTPDTKPLRWEIDIISWSNPNSSNVTVSNKFSQSDATGNLASANYIMTANGSGTNATALYENAEYSARNFSSYAIQVYNSSPSTNVTLVFKVRLFCDGVRYL